MLNLALQTTINTNKYNTFSLHKIISYAFTRFYLKLQVKEQLFKPLSILNFVLFIICYTSLRVSKIQNSPTWFEPPVGAKNRRNAFLTLWKKINFIQKWYNSKFVIIYKRWLIFCIISLKGINIIKLKWKYLLLNIWN